MSWVFVKKVIENCNSVGLGAQKTEDMITSWRSDPHSFSANAFNLA